MNSLLVLPEEFDGQKATITGARALHLFETHELRAGQSVRAALWNGQRGHVEVQASSRDEVVLECRFDLPALGRLPCVLVAAVPRPQTLKKLLQLAAMLGVKSLHLCGSEKSQKSYLQSKGLTASALTHQSVLGLEQVWDSIPPFVKVHRNLSSCLDEATLADAGKFIADPRGSSLTVDHFSGVSEATPATFMIGPEAGWSEREVETVTRHGFQPVRLGERAVRVEVAAALFTGALQLALQTRTFRPRT